MKGVFLWAGSALWSGINGCVQVALGRGWLQPKALPARVISVGNIQVGGAGKTPLVARIAREAHERGIVTAILCRGYGGRWEKDGGVLVPGSSGEHATLCGDEAALLHELAPHAWIGVGADRARSFEACRREAMERIGKPIELVVLDDGFQHWKIRKDVEVVALTSRRAGQILFRNGRSALKRAQLLVWTKGDQEPLGLRQSGIPWVRVRYRFPACPTPDPVFLVTGIGDGESARAELAQAGYKIQRHFDFADHARYDERQVGAVVQEALRAGMRIVITGKDWVKWRHLGARKGSAPGEVFVVEPELVFEPAEPAEPAEPGARGVEHWERVLWPSG